MKNALEILVRSLPERSMRMQMRFELVQGLRDLRYRYNREQRSDNAISRSLDRLRFDAWAQEEDATYYLRPVLQA